MVIEFPDDFVVICPLEKAEEKFRLYTNEALQTLYNKLGFNHTLDRLTLVERLTQFCEYAEPSNVMEGEPEYQARYLDIPRTERYAYINGYHLQAKKAAKTNLRNIFVKGLTNPK